MYVRKVGAFLMPENAEINKTSIIDLSYESFDAVVGCLANNGGDNLLVLLSAYHSEMCKELEFIIMHAHKLINILLINSQSSHCNVCHQTGAYGKRVFINVESGCV